MIKGLNLDITPRGLDRGLRSETSSPSRGAEKASFADQLLGAKNEGLESPNRNERTVKLPRQEQDAKSGRKFGSDTDSEGARSSRRDPESEAPTKLRAQKESKKTAPKRKDSPSSSTQELVNSTSAESTRVERLREQEKSPKSLEKTSARSDVKLPDFFSKDASATTGAKGAAALGAAAGTSVAQLGAQSGTQAASESLQLMQALQQDSASDRASAMQEFLESMQQELGIPPEKVLQAFSELSPESLSASPQASMDEFLLNLDLDPAQEERAAELYSDMVDATAEAALTERLATLQSGVNFDIKSRREASLQSLSTSLDAMNQSFFSKEGALAQSAKGQPAQAAQAVESLDAELARLMFAEQATQPQQMAPSMAQQPQQMAASMAQQPEVGVELDATQLGSEDLTAESESESSEDAAPGLGLGSKLASAVGLGAMAAGAAEGSASGFGQNMGEGFSQGSGGGSAASSKGDVASQLKAALAKETSFASQMKAGDKAEAASAGSETLGPVVGETATGYPVGHSLAGSAMPLQSQAADAALAGGPAAMMSHRAPTTEDEQANVRELIKQAQIVLKKGGGEMKMEMSPEGMGQVHLRVAVENGQVNIQMLTESDSAKRLLEKGLHELKTSLAAEQLRVDSLKVDVGREIQKQMDQNANQDASREQARQFAQDFMGGFRDDRQSFRQGMFEGSGFKSYGRPQNRMAMEPEPVVQSASASRSSEGSRRLNLVA